MRANVRANVGPRGRKIAVCLLSGGIDSTVAAYYARSLGYDVYTLWVNYGQLSAKQELDRVKKIAHLLGTKEQKTLNVADFASLSLSPLTGHGRIPNHVEQNTNGEIPSIHPPGRDLLLMWLGIAWAESIWLQNLKMTNQIEVLMGTNRDDSRTYPDCKPDTYKQINEIVKTSTKLGVQYKKWVTVVTPLIQMSKLQVAELGLRLGVPLDLTWSCYKGTSKPCGVCGACRHRTRVFEKLDIKNNRAKSNTHKKVTMT